MLAEMDGDIEFTLDAITAFIFSIFYSIWLLIFDETDLCLTCKWRKATYQVSGCKSPICSTCIWRMLNGPAANVGGHVCDLKITPPKYKDERCCDGVCATLIPISTIKKYNRDITDNKALKKEPRLVTDGNPDVARIQTYIETSDKKEKDRMRDANRLERTSTE